MSLHKFAEQVASQGRGDDSLLVHMTPDEVRNLQQFAQANGRSLTINPETGLPEAGMLSDLFKAIAPIALGAFLGPAGLGMSSMMAGVATGGITTLATGSLSRGLMAGLGAYGGAGLGESFMTAGGGMSAANAATTAQQQLSGANLALGEAMPAQAAEQFTKDAVARMTPSGAVSAGFNKAIASPTAALDFAKNNMGNLAYAAAPIAAGLMVPTTTKMPDPKDTGYIRQYDFNIDPETGRPNPLYGLRAMTPVKASEFGNKTFQGQRDLFRQQNPNPYELGVGSLNQPPLQQPAQMNTGGIVALARGGVPGYAEGDLILDAYKKGEFKIANDLINKAGLSAQDIVSKYNLDAAQSAEVAKNLGYTGDLNPLKLQYGTGYVESPVIQAPPVVQATQTAPPVVQTAPPVVQATQAAQVTAPPVTQATTQATTQAAPKTDYKGLVYDSVGGSRITTPTGERYYSPYGPPPKKEELDWLMAQPTDAYLNSLAPMERSVALQTWQKSRPGYVDPMNYNTYEDYVSAANIKDTGDITNRANFYGLSIEDYNNVLSGDMTRPMGANKSVYGAKLLSPLEQLAAQTARGQGITPTTQSPEMQALMQKYPTFFVDYAKKHPEIFNKASQDFSNFMSTTYPGTLEYQSVLSGPMKYSSTGVEYPKIDNTASMYVLDPATKQIKVNPDYSATKSDGTARMYIRDPVTGRIVKNPKYKPPVRKAEGGLTGLAGGGIVALAGGGDYRSLTKDSSADDIASAYKQFTTASGGDTAANQQAAISYLTNLGIGQDKIGQAYGTYQASPTYTDYTPEQMGSFLANPVNKDINLDKAIIDTNANPYAVNQYIASLTSGYTDPTATKGGSGTAGYFNTLTAQGIDPNEYYAAMTAVDPNYATQGFSKADIAEQYDIHRGANALTAQIEKDKIAADPKLGYDKQWVKFMDDNKYSVLDAARAFGLSIGEVQRRYDAVKAAEVALRPTTPLPQSPVKPPITSTTPITYNTAGTNPPTPIESVLGLPPGVSGAGITTVNPGGTITTRPDIPGIPEGGFTGMTDLRKAYTDGGGSLGYTSKAPKTMEEFNQLYNKQTGDSLAAYDYLMGKGANKNAYPVKSGVPKIAVPYDEFVLGRKPTSLKPKTTTTTTTVKGTPGQPQTYFDEKAYLAANPDVEAEMKAGKSKFATAYEHWLMYGQAEGRPFTGDYSGYLTASALVNTGGGGGGGGVDGGPGGGGGGGGGTGGNAAGAAAAAAGGNAAPGTGNSAASAAAAAAAAAAASVGVGDGVGAVGGKNGGMAGYAIGGGLGSLGSYSDGGRLLRGPGDGVSDSIPATIGRKQQPARLADGEFVIPARIVSELGNGSTDAGAKKLYAMMDRVQRARGKTTGKNKVAANSRSDKYLPA